MTEERRAGGPGDGPSRILQRLLLGISLLPALLLLMASRTQSGGIPAGVAASDLGHLRAASQDFVTVRVEMKEFAFAPAVIRAPRSWPGAAVSGLQPANPGEQWGSTTSCVQEDGGYAGGTGETSGNARSADLVRVFVS